MKRAEVFAVVAVCLVLVFAVASCWDGIKTAAAVFNALVMVEGLTIGRP